MPAPAPCSRRCSPSSCGGIFWSDTYSTTCEDSDHDSAAFLSCFRDRVCGRVLGRVRDLGLEKLCSVHLPPGDERDRLGCRKAERRRSCDVLVWLAGDLRHRGRCSGLRRLLPAAEPDAAPLVRLVLGGAGSGDGGLLLSSPWVFPAVIRR